MFNHHVHAILVDEVTKEKVFYSFKTYPDNKTLVKEFLENNKDVELINMELETKDRDVIISKEKFKKNYLESKIFEETGLFNSDQVWEEILEEGDLIALYCSVRKAATIFKIEKIRKGILGFFLGIYKTHNLKGVVKNTNDLRSYKDWSIYNAYPSTRFFRLTEVKVIIIS
jgi:hypothetical protein